MANADHSGTAESGQRESSPSGDDSEASWRGAIGSVADGLAFSTVGKFLIMGAGFGLNLLLTRGLGVALYGVFAFGQKITTTILIFTNFGSDVSVMKFVAANTDDPDYQRQILGVSYLTTLVVGGIIAVGLFLAAPVLNDWTLADPRFETVLRLFALTIPFQGLVNIAINSFRGLERAGYQTGIRALPAVCQVLSVAVALALGLSLYGIVAAFTLGTGLAFAISLSVLLRRTHLYPTLGLSRAQIKEFFDFSVPFTFSRAGAILYRRTDVFMVGLLLSASAVGVYNVALIVATLISVPLTGLNQLFPSVASRLYADGDRETLAAVYTTVTRWSITASLPIALPLIVYREAMLSIFGTEFVAGAMILLAFAVGQLVNVSAGPSNDVLTMTDHQYLVMVNHWTFGVLNIVLNYVLIVRMGVVGAAVATAFVLAMLNVARVVEVWYLEGLFAYTRRLWKPVVAIAIATVAMLAIRDVVSGMVALLGGGAIGVLVYAAVLLALGIDDRDREVANRYVSFGD